MKINRRNPLHWICLALFSMNVALALLLRPFFRGRRQAIVLYGHKFSGNLRALYREIQRSGGVARPVIYLSLDIEHARSLKAQGANVVSAVHPSAAVLLAQAAAIVTDHGLHVMQPLLDWTDIRFFDVWHGIPFKGFDAEDFKVLRRYDETWVASPLLADFYVHKFGFERSRVIVTGYARTDRLVTRTEDVARIRQRVGAPAAGPLILFAPTWVQDDKGRSLYPFGCSEGEFLRALCEIALRHGGALLMRTHLNSGAIGSGLRNVVSVPQSRFPDTEEILLITDLLICDWSSIAFDYLVLERPALFLDVPAPFKKGFSLGPEYRFGPVIRSLDELIGQADGILAAPEQYRAEHAPRLRSVKASIYGDFADGRSAQRCVERLAFKLASVGSSQ
jgi:CDP-glycerol glycerophosphotransferase (TagB/SpsB family)